jgi:CubicO group peptidase (beta-lactamase class C family)
MKNPYPILPFFFAFFLLFLGCSPTNMGQDEPGGFHPERLKRIRQVQQELVDQELFGSNQVIIFKDGKRIYDQVVNSKREGDADITEQTIFPLFSMSKPITTVAMMILLEEGRLILDDPIKKYMPEMDSLQCLDENKQPYLCKREVTVRHLLTHESGWTYYMGEKNGVFSIISDTDYTDLEDFSRDMAERPLLFEPGTSYAYGLSSALQGRLIEAVTGQSFYDFLKEKIFDPLEMPNTKFDLTEAERKVFQPLLRVDDPALLHAGTPDPGFHSNKYDELSYEPGTKVQLGGEGLVSTANDYSHFCEMLLNDGNYKGKQIISPTSVAWMHYPLQPPSKYGDWKGFATGFTYYHLSEPLQDGTLSPEGIFGWGGYHSTWFWIDQTNNLFGLTMARRTPTSHLMFDKVRLATYQALN